MKKQFFCIVVIIFLFLVSFSVWAEENVEPAAAYVDTGPYYIPIGIGITFVIGWILGTVCGAIMTLFLGKPSLRPFIIKCGAQAGAAGGAIGFIIPAVIKRFDWINDGPCIGFTVAMIIIWAIGSSLPEK